MKTKNKSLYFVTGQKPVEEKENFPTCMICKEEFLHEDTLKIHNKLRPNCLEPKNPPKPSRKRQSMERIGLSVTKEKVKARKHKRSSDEDSDESSESDSGMFYNLLDLEADSHNFLDLEADSQNFPIFYTAC